jgi:hypothetical protein
MYLGKGRERTITNHTSDSMLLPMHRQPVRWGGRESWIDELGPFSLPLATWDEDWAKGSWA